MSEFSIKRLEAGKEILVEVANHAGMTVVLSNLGASLKSCKKPGRELTLGYADPDTYRHNPSYLATTVGRFGNRIAKGSCIVDGKPLTLERNNGENHLHGGSGGFHSRYWNCELVEGRLTSADKSSIPVAGAAFTLTSQDGDQGYPGTLNARVVIVLSADNQLAFFYHATSSATTPLNLTNHSYWNLAGENGGTIHDHGLRLAAPGWLEVDSGSIPTGQFVPMLNSAWDFSKDRLLSSAISPAGKRTGFTKGIDHTFIVDPEQPSIGISLQTKTASGVSLHQEGKIRFVACLTAPKSPCMDVFTSSPGVQVYTGNHLDDISGRNGTLPIHGGICLETQFFPDSPNQGDTFRDIGRTIGYPKTELRGWDGLLKIGDTWDQVTVHRFS